MANTNVNRKDDLSLEQETERQELIALLGQAQPQTQLGAQLLTLRLKMLKQGQPLVTIDEINQVLQRFRAECSAADPCPLIPASCGPTTRCFVGCFCGQGSGIGKQGSAQSFRLNTLAKTAVGRERNENLY